MQALIIGLGISEILECGYFPHEIGGGGPQWRFRVRKPGGKKFELANVNAISVVILRGVRAFFNPMKVKAHRRMYENPGEETETATNRKPDGYETLIPFSPKEKNKNGDTGS